MIRRSFFQTLAAALLPQPILATAKPAQAPCAHTARVSHSAVTVRDPEWLREWREIPKLEVIAKDLPDHEDPHQRMLGAVIRRHINEGSSFTFRYVGGSEPGVIRTVLPTLLARRFPGLRFRSGNATGADEAFSSGIIATAPERLEIIAPYPIHKAKGLQAPIA